MNVKIICAGKVKEQFYRDAAAEYLKRLKRFAKFEIKEVKDEPTDSDLSGRINEMAREKEGARMLEAIRPGDYVIALAIDGKTYDSLSWSKHLAELFLDGHSSLVFVIGGSTGLSEAVLNRADEHLSFSRFTFPHQLMRVILLEQIYRAFKIRSGEEYHK